MIDLVKMVIAFLVVYSPAVLTIYFLCSIMWQIRAMRREDEENRARRAELSKVMYILALELRRINNRVEKEASAGEEENK